MIRPSHLMTAFLLILLAALAWMTSGCANYSASHDNLRLRRPGILPYSSTA